MDISFYINSDIIFDPKATAVPYNYRISYKIALICAIIGKCCGKKGCSAIKLQMINAATISQKVKAELFSLISNPFVMETTIIRFDPAISRAINLALADEIIYRQSNGLYRLKDKGKKLVDLIYEDDTVMMVEKQLLTELSNKLTEGIIDCIADNWRVEESVKNKQN